MSPDTVRYIPIHFDTFRYMSIHFDTFIFLFWFCPPPFRLGLLDFKLAVLLLCLLLLILLHPAPLPPDQVRFCFFVVVGLRFSFSMCRGLPACVWGARGLDACGALGALGAGRPQSRNAARQRRCKCWGGRAAEHVCAAVLRNLCKYSRQSR